MIKDHVSIMVLVAKGNQIRLGLNAPKNVAVHRAGICNRINRQQTGAPHLTP